MNRRQMIRRGGTYGPPLPEGMPEDGVERGIAALSVAPASSANSNLQQNVWTNDRTFPNSATT